MIPYGTRLKYAFRSFFSLLDYGRIPEDIAEAVRQQAAVTPAAGAQATRPTPTAPPAPSPAPGVSADTADGAVQILALLQRDGRLVDFLMEDLAAYPDAQVGAAVRDVHAGCRAALDKYATLVAVLDDEEGRPVTVERGTDPARVKVVGNVAGDPPYRGVLRHRGWEAERVALPPLPATGRTIVAPAEVEVA
jgi:hypothetical protein